MSLIIILCATKSEMELLLYKNHSQHSDHSSFMASNQGVASLKGRVATRAVTPQHCVKWETGKIKNSESWAPTAASLHMPTSNPPSGDSPGLSSRVLPTPPHCQTLCFRKASLPSGSRHRFVVLAWSQRTFHSPDHSE